LRLSEAVKASCFGLFAGFAKRQAAVEENLL
jgi:hypothetical protein